MTGQKWHRSNKNWNGSSSFCKEIVNFSPFRNGSIHADGPIMECPLCLETIVHDTKKANLSVSLIIT